MTELDRLLIGVVELLENQGHKCIPRQDCGYFLLLRGRLLLMERSKAA